MTSQTTNYFGVLKSVCKDHSSFEAKLLATSLYNKKSLRLFEIAILLIEYLQLISQALLFNPELYDDSDLNTGYQAFIYAAKLINPSFWMFNNSYENLTFIMFICFLLLTVLKFLLAFYIFSMIFWKLKQRSLLIQIWKLIIMTQSRVLCCFITSFWLKAVLVTHHTEVGILGMSSSTISTIAKVMIAFEYGFSLLWLIRYCYILPAKNFLSSKDNYMEIMTLVQKLIAQALLMSSASGLTVMTWIFTSINLLFSIARDSHYISTLPLYDISALLLQGRLLAMVTALNVSYFILNIAESLNYEDDGMSFLIISWIILALLIGKIISDCVVNMSSDFFTNKTTNKSVKYLIHKIDLIKHLRRQKKFPGEHTEKYEMVFLLNLSLAENVNNILNLGSDSNNLNLSSKPVANKLFLEYLEMIQAKFPRDNYLKLYKASLYAKKLQQYAIAMKIIGDIKKTSSAQISLGASLLVYDIENEINQSNKQQTKELDIISYLQSTSHVAEIKEKLIEQIKFQKNLYHEVLEEGPVLEKMFQCAHKIKDYKTDIDRSMNALIHCIPDNFTAPLMIYALYHLTLNHSVTEYRYYRKRYYQKQEKYRKHFYGDKLNKQNIYQENNVFVMFSANRADNGKVVFCTKSIEAVYGGETSLYKGTHVTTLTPPGLREFYTKFYEKPLTEEDQSNFGVSIRDFGFHREGYLIEIDYFLAVHPYLTQGFYYDLIIRPGSTMRDCILIHENGEIEGATQEISEKLGLLKSKNQTSSDSVNIRSLCLELSRVNFAFNLIANLSNSNMEKKLSIEPNMEEFHESPLNKTMPTRLMIGTQINKSFEFKMEIEEAKEIFSLFSSEGKELELSSLLKDKNGYASIKYRYQCTIETRSYGDLKMKIINLNKTKEAKTSEHEHESAFRGKEVEKIALNLKQSYDSENIKSGISDTFDMEDEKQIGWIDFQHFDSKYTQGSLIPVTTPTHQVEEPLMSPMSLDHLITSPKATTVITENKSAEKTPQKKAVQVSKTTKSTHAKNHAKGNYIEDHIPIEMSIGSQRSRTSNEKRVAGAFKIALTVTYSSMSFKLIFVAFYILLIAVFGTQLNSILTINNAVNDMKAGKDVVTYAQLRSYLLGNVQNSFRQIWDIGTGRITSSSGPGGPGGSGGGGGILPASMYINIVGQDLLSLSKANNELFEMANSLPKEKSELLFGNDVRIFDSSEAREEGIYLNHTSFQATDIVVQNGLNTAKVAKTSVTSAEDGINFLLENTVNDLLVTDDTISDTFLAYFDNEQADLSATIMELLGITIALFGVTSLILTFQTWRKYSKEKHNMMAVARLNSQAIQGAIDQIETFERMIENELNIESNEEFEIVIRDKSRKRYYQDMSSKKKNKNDHTKNPDCKDMRKRYYFSTVKIWILIGILVGLTITTSLLGKSSVDFFQKKQNQLYFSLTLKSQINLITTVSQELLAGNGTTLNHNIETQVLLPEALSNLTTMKNEISTVFLDDDLNYDSVIQEVLFFDSCAYVASNWQRNCLQREQQGKQTGLIYLLGELQNYATVRLTSFQTSDRSSASLLSIQQQNYGDIMMDYFMLGSLCETISDIVDADFESEMTSSKNRRNKVFIIYVVLLVVGGYLVWIFVLKELKDANQQLKTVLQAFPAHIVLSSFILKSFLVKTSRGALDSVKNNI